MKLKAQMLESRNLLNRVMAIMRLCASPSCPRLCVDELSISQQLANLPAELLTARLLNASAKLSTKALASCTACPLRQCVPFLLCLALCVATAGASTEVINANLYVTDSPVPSAYGNNATAGDVLVANFDVRDVQTNTTIGNSMGYCVLLRVAGPNQCLYTIQFASGTIQVCVPTLWNMRPLRRLQGTQDVQAGTDLGTICSLACTSKQASCHTAATSG